MSIINDSVVPVFPYEDKDFNYVVKKDSGGSSPLDSLLTEKWNAAQENGVFKYVLNIKKQKTLEGVHGFLAQLNPDRGEKRRRPEDIGSMSQPFDPSLFNFTKIPDKEILFDVGNGDGNDVVAANISPIESYHSLLITERLKCQPQRVTKYSLKRAIDMLLLSNSTYLRVIFNSLCAHASVNHLHWHLYYLRCEMPLESIKLELLKGPIFALVDFPAKGFCFKLSSFPGGNVHGMISWAYFVLDYLQTSGIAHNVYVTRARENSELDVYDDIRIYIWARKSSSGVKSTCDFIPAVCELFGHLSIKSEKGYEELTEDAVAEILSDITSDSFHSVRDNLLAMNLDSSNGLLIPN